MSFLGGAECSTAGNPLSQFTKHVQDDKSLQRDRLVGREGNRALGQGLRSTGGGMGSQDNVSLVVYNWLFIEEGKKLYMVLFEGVEQDDRIARLTSE